MTKASLLDLPDELLCSILSLAEIPPCETASVKKYSIFPLLQVNRRLRHVAFDLFTRTHVVLNLRSSKDKYAVSIPDNPIDKFIESAAFHLIEIPSHWQSLHPYRPAMLRLDVDLDTNLKDFVYLLNRRERSFICTIHGLAFLLHLYHQPEYSQLTISSETIHESSQCQLFHNLLDCFYCSSDIPLFNSENAALHNAGSASNVLRKQDIREIGRPLSEGQADKFVGTVKYVLRLTHSCILRNDFESAVSIVLHLGLPLLNQLPRVAPRWLWTNASRSAFPQLAWPNWKTNTRLSLMFEITRLSMQLLCCAYVAYCICIEEGNFAWVQAHPMVVEQHYLIENFGMSPKEIADFDFVVVLQWIYDCKAKDHTTESRELCVQLLKQLRDAYQAGGCSSIHACVYARVATTLDLEDQVTLPDECLDNEPIDYIDIDGVAQIWDGSLEDWKSWQIPLLGHENQSDLRSRYLHRAQELYHSGDSFEHLLTSFLERFCKITLKSG